VRLGAGSHGQAVPRRGWAAASRAWLPGGRLGAVAVGCCQGATGQGRPRRDHDRLLSPFSVFLVFWFPGILSIATILGLL
jgi:hypothetical protein